METTKTSVLRQRFSDHMTLRGLSANTQEAYLQGVSGLARHYGCSPDRLTNDQIQSYLIHLSRDRGLAWKSCNVAFASVRCFYRGFLGRDETEFSIPPRPRQTQRPQVLSIQEVERLLNALTNVKHRALLMTVYGAGLRVSEAVHLQPSHIESDRMLIRVEQGKGRKDRYTILPQRLLEELRLYWKMYRPGKWLFPGNNPEQPLSIDAAQRVYHQARRAAGITRGRGIHTLRHCFATHLLDARVDLLTIKEWMGHKSLNTTTGYLHVSTIRRASVSSPLDALNLPSPR